MSAWTSKIKTHFGLALLFIFFGSCQKRHTEGNAPSLLPIIRPSPNSAPVLSAIADQAVYEGRIKTVPVIVDDSDSSLACSSSSLNVQSSNIDLIPVANISIEGSYPECSITLTLAPGQSGQSTITISATDTVNTVSQTFLVSGFKVTSVKLSPQTPIIPKNSNFSFSLMAVYSDATERNITNSATWTTSNSGNTAFQSSGVLNNSYTGSSNVTSIISASYGVFSASTMATINAATITALIVDINSANMNIGGQLQLSCFGLTSDGGSINLTGSCAWSSENELIASVDNSLDKGLVTGRSLGSPTAIIASYGTFSANSLVTVDINPPASSDNGLGLTAKYFLGTNFTTLTNTRVDSTVNFNWTIGQNPAGSADAFSVRWTGYIKAPVTGVFTFFTRSDDGVRLWINNIQIVNNWTDHAVTENSGTVNLVAGQKYPVTLEFYENGGYAEISLSYSAAGLPKQIVPQINLFPD